MTTPLVTVIIPVYNVEMYIDCCVQSVINQTYKNLDIILVDDGSPDNCPEICDRYANIDNRITVIHKENAGLGMARNSGLMKAKGEYVLFIDSDDWMDEDRIERMVDAINTDNCEAVITGYTLCTATGQIIRKQPLLKVGRFVNKEVSEDILLEMIAAPLENPNDDTLPVGSVFKLYSLNIIKNNNLRFISEKDCLAEDVFFNTEYFSLCNSIRIIENFGYYYRMNPKSISNTYTTERANRGFKYYNNLMRLIKAKGLYRQGKHVVERSYIGKVRVALKLIVNMNKPYSWKKEEMIKILSHPYTIEALNSYPINKYNFGLKTTAYCMRKRWVIGTYICFMIRRVLKKAN